MKKYEFMYRLDRALGALSEEEKNDIINDYEEHFRIGAEEGKTDDEICATLGAPEELAKSYLEEVEQPKVENENVTEGGELPAQVTPMEEPKNSENNIVGIIAVVLLTIFVFLPVGSTLLGILAGMFFTSLGCGLGGIATFCAAFFAIAEVGAFIGILCIGIALVAFGILMGFATYYAGKGLYKLLLMIIDFCKDIMK